MWLCQISAIIRRKFLWNDEEKARIRKLNARDVSIFQSFYFAANVPEMMAEC